MICIGRRASRSCTGSRVSDADLRGAGGRVAGKSESLAACVGEQQESEDESQTECGVAPTPVEKMLEKGASQAGKAVMKRVLSVSLRESCPA